MYKLEGKIYICPVEALSNLLGKKWVAKILWYIGEDKKNFSSIKRKLNGCSTKVLIQQLRRLQDLGLVINDKKVLSNNEVSSLYYLSEKGLSILPVLYDIIMWGNDNLKC